VRLLPDRRSHGGRNDNYNVGLQCHELSCQGFHCVDRTAGPTLFDPNVAALRPSQCLQSLNERSTVAKAFGVTCNFRPQYRNLRQTCWLLRVRRKGPRGGRAANKRDELAPLHGLAQAEEVTAYHIEWSCCAVQQSRKADVRCGSQADMAQSNSDVRFTPKSRHSPGMGNADPSRAGRNDAWLVRLA
jgi:hypothetical protein